MSSSMEDELMAVAQDWDRAMVTNEAAAIGRFMADDWVIIGPDGRVDDKASFREVERSSCVFVRQAGQWRCVLTHLSRLVEIEVR